MIREYFKNDSYFEGDVLIEVIPHSNCTEVDLFVFCKDNHRWNWTLCLDIITSEPFEALEELKKDKYICVGCSTTF